MDTLDEQEHYAQVGHLASVPFQRRASMTDAELRIIEFLMTSDATRPAHLPDWLLDLLGGDRRRTDKEVSRNIVDRISV